MRNYRKPVIKLCVESFAGWQLLASLKYVCPFFVFSFSIESGKWMFVLHFYFPFSVKNGSNGRNTDIRNSSSIQFRSCYVNEASHLLHHELEGCLLTGVYHDNRTSYDTDINTEDLAITCCVYLWA